MKKHYLLLAAFLTACILVSAQNKPAYHISGTYPIKSPAGTITLLLTVLQITCMCRTGCR